MKIENSNVYSPQGFQGHQEQAATQGLMNEQRLHTFNQTNIEPHIFSHCLGAMNTQLAELLQSPSSSAGFERSLIALNELKTRLLEPPIDRALSIPLTGKGLGGAGNSSYDRAQQSQAALQLTQLKNEIDALKDLIQSKEAEFQTFDRVLDRRYKKDVPEFSDIEKATALGRQIELLQSRLRSKESQFEALCPQ